MFFRALIVVLALSFSSVAQAYSWGYPVPYNPYPQFSTPYVSVPVFYARPYHWRGGYYYTPPVVVDPYWGNPYICW